MSSVQCSIEIQIHAPGALKSERKLRSCLCAAASEQVASEPPWVAEVGPDVVTQQGYRSDDTHN